MLIQKKAAIAVAAAFAAMLAGCQQSITSPESGQTPLTAITAASPSVAVSTSAPGPVTTTSPPTAVPTPTKPTTRPPVKPTTKAPTKPAAKNLCGAPANPYGYNFCGGSTITNPPSDICSYLSCIDNFWNGRGYVIQCKDGMFSKSGGISGSCSYHSGNRRALNK